MDHTHPSTDPFAALGLEPRFDLTDAEIEAAYLARVATVHPDAAPAGIAPADPAALNDARAALLDAERRANAMLAHLGGPGPSDDKSLPDGFLMEMMETRGEIEDAIASGGDAERTKWEAWADEQRAGFVQDVTARFASADGSQPQTLADIRTRLNAWRYIERLIEQLDPDYDPAHADFNTPGADR